MAVTVAFTTKQGVVCTTPYIVITKVNFSKIPNKNFTAPTTVPNTTAYASVYYNQAAYTAQNDPLQDIMFQFNVGVLSTDPSIYSQAYTALKALPSMAGATDC